MFTIPCRRRILIVDQDIELRANLNHLLAGEGIDTCEADNGEQAIASFCRHPLDLVIAELKPDGREEIEIVAQLCREVACTRIIATAQIGRQPLEHFARDAARLGAQTLLGKPFSPRQFLAAVHRAFGKTDHHSFSPAIKLAIPRRLLSAPRMTTGSFSTGPATTRCHRGLHRWRRGNRRFL